jgi:hypothetical protein
MSAGSIPLDTLVEVTSALALAKSLHGYPSTPMTKDQYDVIVKAWARISWRVEAMLEAQRVEVAA